MRSLGLIVPARGNGSDYFTRALTVAFRQRSGGESAPPVLAMTIDSARTGPLPSDLCRVLTKMAAGGAARVAIADFRSYCVAREITPPLPAALLDPVVPLAHELTARSPLRRPLVGFLGSSALLQSRTFRDLRKAFGDVVILDGGFASALDKLIDRLGVANPKPDDVRRVQAFASQLRAAGADEIVIGAGELSAALDLFEPRSEFVNRPALYAEAAVTWILGDETSERTCLGAIRGATRA